MTDDIVDRLRNSCAHTCWCDRENAYGVGVESANEIERLRALITEWADAEDAYSVDDRPGWFGDCRDALRQAVGR